MRRRAYFPLIPVFVLLLVLLGVGGAPASLWAIVLVCIAVFAVALAAISAQIRRAP